MDTIELREKALELRSKELDIRERELAIREAELQAKWTKTQPITLNSHAIHFGSREEVGAMLGLIPDTISELVADSVLPPPCDLTAIRNGNKPRKRGRRLLLWDLYEVAVWGASF